MRNSRQSYKEYDPEKVEERSELFLKRIMGEEKFDKLRKDGKIEIEVDNKSSGKTIYELRSDGNVINKTKNQRYCIVADRSDYPINDIIAIKYAHLVHNNDLVEKVANRTHLYTGVTDRVDGVQVPVAYGDFVRDMEQRGWNRQQVRIDNTPGYADYVDYMLGRGWHRELITIDENNTHISNIQNIHRDTTGCVIDIVCPTGMKMSIMGMQQVPRGADANISYSLGLYIIDENGKEIPDDTNIRIEKERTCEAFVQLARIYYSEIKMRDRDTNFRFRQGVELNSQEHLMIYIVNSGCNVPAENVKFALEADIWVSN